MKATPTPASWFKDSISSRLKSFFNALKDFGFNIAKASGKISGASWWSVIITSTLKPFANFTCSTSLTPQSTVIINFVLGAPP